MVIIDDVLVSDDVLSKAFVCNLNACKGACCEEGDWGAPLETDEISQIENVLDAVKPYMSQTGLQVLEKQGFAEKDPSGDWVTTTYKGGACVFATKSQNGQWQCALENAYQDGATTFKKPISCHLYPIRVSKQKHHEALNYDKWDICSPACSLGEALKVPVYTFLKEPLIRKYGETWYKALHYSAQSDPNA